MNSEFPTRPVWPGLFLQAQEGPGIERIDRQSAPALLKFTPWESIPGLVQGVTVKDGDGVGTDYDTLASAAGNLGFGRLLRLRQVHGARVLETGDECFGQEDKDSRPEGDGIIGGGAGVLGVVSVADCVPAFLLERGTSAWAVVHTGWRGVAAGVLAEAVAGLAGCRGVHPGRLELYLGPSICGRCYEVGGDVAGVLAEAGAGTGINSEHGKILADLRAILAVQAGRAGLESAKIFTSAYCTSCRNDLFCSFRAEGERGLRRMWGIIGFSSTG